MPLFNLNGLQRYLLFHKPANICSFFFFLHSFFLLFQFRVKAAMYLNMTKNKAWAMPRKGSRKESLCKNIHDFA